MDKTKYTHIDDLMGAIQLVSQLSNLPAFITFEDGYLVGMRKNDRWKVVELPVNALSISTVREVNWNECVLFAPYIPPQTAQMLNECNARYIDMAGNARLSNKNSHIFIAGQKPRNKPKASRVVKPIYGQKSALKVLYVLLKDSDLLKAPYREIMNVAKVSLGSVSSSISKMKDERILYESDSGLGFLDYKETLTRWAMMYATILKPSLQTREFESNNSALDILEMTDPRMFNGVWGGEAGGFSLTHYLTPTEITLYVGGENQKEFIHLARLRATTPGITANTKVTIVEPFWNTDSLLQNTQACPLLTYAELLAGNDPRLLDTAKRIAHEYLEESGS